MENYFLNKDGDKWKLCREGADRSAIVSDTKSEALKKSVEFMKGHGGSMKIQKLDGKIQEERTYPRSSDPKKTPG